MLTSRSASLLHNPATLPAVADPTGHAMEPAPREAPVLPARGQMLRAAPATKASLSPVRAVLCGPASRGRTESPGIAEPTAGTVEHVTARIAAHVESGALQLRGQYAQPVLRAAARRAAEGCGSLLKAKAGAGG